MSRAGAQNFWQAAAAAGSRFHASPVVIVAGEIASYDPATHLVTVKIDMGGERVFTTPPTQINLPWHGDGYSDANGPEEGHQVSVAVVDPEANEFLVLGYTANDKQPGINVPAGESKRLDKRGSFSHFAEQRGGMIRHYGAGTASIFGGTSTEVGGENLDASNDAIIRKADLDAALTAQAAHFQTQLQTWASANLQGGSGAGGPALSSVTSTGSSKARAVP